MRPHWVFPFLLLVTASAPVVSCAPAKECGETDQRGSFMPPLNKIPADVKIDSSFTEKERREIKASVAIWNAYSQSQIKKNFFNVVEGNVDPSVRSFNGDACSADQREDDTIYIVKERNAGVWTSMNLPERALAVTQRCIIDSGAGRLLNQVMFINADKTSNVQFKSVVLHELGHAIGLDHSCSPNEGKTDFRSCSTLADGHPYRIALMYPDVDERSPVEILKPNDRQRAACRYEDQ